jgi:hypothetical protein
VADNQATPFQIRVLEGELTAAVLQDGQAPGVLQLVSRSGPFKGLTFETKQRVKTRWYPGNPEATQQVIGPMEEPTTVTGQWMDRYLGDGAALALVEMVDDITRRGVSVEVSWGSALVGDVLTGSQLTRVGIISAFRKSFDRIEDVSWSITFDWRGRGQGAAPPVAATARANPREEFTATTASLDVSSASWEALRDGPLVRPAGGIPAAVRARIDDAFAAVGRASEALAQAGDQIAAVSVVPLHEARAVVGACEQARDGLGQVIDQVLSLRPLALEVVDSAIGVLRLRSSALDLFRTFSVSQERCVDTANGVLEHAEPDVVAEVRAPAGTDLRDLAIRYYGDPDMWWAIAQFNGIDSSQVPSAPSGPSDDPARPIRIPRAQAIASLDRVC